ncbi:MAG TPA: (5-formylfuran-3-yl)methyl phosphate synthase [Burkholderiaceae bacterium]|nr:(5-formylfuran-3-yl)methyl phosphate synthase [Burkholderiaceae bacterium]
MRLLVSAKDLGEALAAAAAGADFIDLKDPAAGALGGLPIEHIGTITTALRERRPDGAISATIGDADATPIAEVLMRVGAVAACGVDYVKVGVEPGARASALLDALAGSGAPVVPVLIADHGVDMALVERALRSGAYPALMLDTVDKRAGSLLQRLAPTSLRAFLAATRRRATLSGLAGALRVDDVPQLLALAPDFAGFRSAVCAQRRDGALDAQRVRALKAALRGESAVAAGSALT